LADELNKKEEEINKCKVFSPRKSFLAKFGEDLQLPNYTEIYENAQSSHQEKELLQEEINKSQESYFYF
jgi:hypothetical protein